LAYELTRMSVKWSPRLVYSGR